MTCIVSWELTWLGDAAELVAGAPNPDAAGADAPNEFAAAELAGDVKKPPAAALPAGVDAPKGSVAAAALLAGDAPKKLPTAELPAGADAPKGSAAAAALLAGVAPKKPPVAELPAGVDDPNGRAAAAVLEGIAPNKPPAAELCAGMLSEAADAAVPAAHSLISPWRSSCCGSVGRSLKEASGC